MSSLQQIKCDFLNTVSEMDSIDIFENYILNDETPSVDVFNYIDVIKESKAKVSLNFVLKTVQWIIRKAAPKWHGKILYTYIKNMGFGIQLVLISSTNIDKATVEANLLRCPAVVSVRFSDYFSKAFSGYNCAN